MKDLIVALEESGAKARRLVKKLGPAVTFYKVPPATTLEDPGFIPWLRARRKRVFLDCKWHDIPSQVNRSVAAAGKMGITACTIHAGAGTAVMKAALAAKPRPKIWAVSVLTSLDNEDLKEVGIEAGTAAQVTRLAKLAQKNGIDGLVCSPQEVRWLRQKGIRLPLITPGIQLGGRQAKDQKRVATPESAWRDGSNYLVVGRAVLAAPDPRRAVAEILSAKKA